MTDSDIGIVFKQYGRLDQPIWQLLILYQIGLELESEVEYQNRLICYNSVEENDMREVKDLAAGMRQAIANLKQVSVAAKDKLNSEVARANVNASKVTAFATELSDANKEVEAFLGDTGSNFPTSEGSPTPHADINGVTLNTGNSK